MVCPAYQSAFIYDKDALRKKFSYFKEDSTPKIYTASKNQFLIAEPTTLRKKTREMRTVEAKPVQPVVPDSISGKEDGDLEMSDFSLAEVAIDDSIAIGQQREAAYDSALTASTEDSIYVISKDREVRLLRYNFPDSMKYDAVLDKYVPEKPYYYVEEVGFNTEQNNYMWYLREWLVLPDVKLAQRQNKEEEAAGASGKKKKKGGFFRRLFNKKDKKKDQEELVEGEDEEEPEETIDFKDLESPDSTASVGATSADAPPVPTEEKKKKKKKGFSLFKKKNKDKKSKGSEDPAKKEDEDDGF